MRRRADVNGFVMNRTGAVMNGTRAAGGGTKPRPTV